LSGSIAPPLDVPVVLADTFPALQAVELSSPDEKKPVLTPESELRRIVAFNFSSEANCWVVSCQIEANQISSHLI
jgi:hypothetical protein